MSNLRLKRHFSIVGHSPDLVELRYGVWNPKSISLSDESESGQLFRVLRRLDGAFSPAEIAAAEKVAKSDVEALLDHLVEMNVIETEGTSLLDHYVDENVPLLRSREAAANSRPIRLLGDPALTAEIQRILASSLNGRAEVVVEDRSGEPWLTLTSNDTAWLHDGVAFERELMKFDAWRDHLVVYAAQAIDPLRFRTLNRVSLALDVAWIHAAIDGPFLFVGPTFIPNRTACYECLETRVLMNLRERDSYVKYKAALAASNVAMADFAIEPALRALLASQTALEVLNFVLTSYDFTLNKILAIYLPTMEFSYNEVLRLPRCAACGALSERDDEEFYFDLTYLLEES